MFLSRPFLFRFFYSNWKYVILNVEVLLQDSCILHIRPYSNFPLYIIFNDYSIYSTDLFLNQIEFVFSGNEENTFSHVHFRLPISGNFFHLLIRNSHCNN